MLRFDILTIFPYVFEGYFRESIIRRAQKNKRIGIRTHDLRDFTSNRHRKVDDKPFGGGAGMILQVEPIFRAIKKIKNQKSKIKNRVILFSAKGKQFTQRDAARLSKYEQVILICGRYEGVDERVAKYIADEELSIGPYVLTGGEVPAMVVVDAVSRLIPGVLGNIESLREESFSFFETKHKKKNLGFGNWELGISTEYPQYTRPAVFYPNPRNRKIAWRVPKVLLSGDHKKIESWKLKHTKRSR